MIVLCHTGSAKSHPCNRLNLFNRQKTTATSTERENAKLFYDSTEYPKAKKVNGRFVLPWSGSRLPSMLVAAQWFLGSPNNSSVPGGGLKDFFQFDDKVQKNKLT